VSILNLEIMNNRKDNSKKSSQIILVLLVLFFVILLQEATTGTLNSTWVPLALMGATVIGLPALAKLLSYKKGGDVLNDR
jgi:hypothetical protein